MKYRITAAGESMLGIRPAQQLFVQPRSAIAHWEDRITQYQKYCPVDPMPFRIGKMGKAVALSVQNPESG